MNVPWIRCFRVWVANKFCDIISFVPQVSICIYLFVHVLNILHEALVTIDTKSSLLTVFCCLIDPSVWRCIGCVVSYVLHSWGICVVFLLHPDRDELIISNRYNSFSCMRTLVHTQLWTTWPWLLWQQRWGVSVSLWRVPQAHPHPGPPTFCTWCVCVCV